MRVIRATVNAFVLLTSPLWILPGLIFMTIDAMKCGDQGVTNVITGKTWIF